MINSLSSTLYSKEADYLVSNVKNVFRLFFDDPDLFYVLAPRDAYS
jgi:hypothetical protein